MHLTLIISSLNPGGSERVLSELANAWVKKGYKISFILFAASTEVPFYPLHHDINLIFLNQSQQESSSLLIRLRNIYRRVLCVRKTLKSLKPDMIISFIDVTNITTLLANIGLKIPVLVAERTQPSYHNLCHFYKVLRLYTYCWAEKIIVQTQAAADYFPKKFQSHIAIIPNAVKISPYQKSSSDILKPVRKICSIGRLCPYKDFDVLIQAFAEIVLENPDLELIIYGEGQERLNLESIILKLNLSEKVHLPGTIKDVYETLSQADLFVFPSRYEGFPNVLCEAMSVGLPVIASNCSGNIDIIRDRIDGRFFPVGDVKSLKMRLVELLKNSSQRQKLSQEALKITERFCEQKVFKYWDKIINETIHTNLFRISKNF
ncbi:MAG: glycosyltransferase family 4 protein [Alphaproteobacteria bacterium]|nr:glycosyltransferase family 4 protein [Alphaproteobacteria bacterium]